MTELNLELIVDGTLPSITSNFEALKTAIQTRLEDYKIQVTEDNLAQAKKDATELGKAATQLNKIKTEKAKEFSAPVDLFKQQVVELVEMIQQGQNFIKKQVEVFENKTRKVCEEKMVERLREFWIELEVKAPFQKSLDKIIDLVGISKVSKNSGNLTKAAEDSVRNLALADRAQQNLIEGRLEKLKSASFEAGLKLPIQASCVWSFIGDNDSDYAVKLAKVVQVELTRQNQLIALEKEKLEKEAKLAAEKENEKKLAFDREKMFAEMKAKNEEAIRIETDKKLFELSQVQPVPTPPQQTITPGQKRKLKIISSFIVETSKTSQEDLMNFSKFVACELSKTKLPPAVVTIYFAD